MTNTSLESADDPWVSVSKHPSDVKCRHLAWVSLNTLKDGTHVTHVNILSLHHSSGPNIHRWDHFETYYSDSDSYLMSLNCSLSQSNIQRIIGRIHVYNTL